MILLDRLFLYVHICLFVCVIGFNFNVIES